MLPVKKQKERLLNFSKNKEKSAQESLGAPRALNVFFNFNGHSFDAYEVLGVPAGSTIEEIHLAFQKSMTSSDEGSKEFFSAAFQAIQQAQSK